ncbi:hypothetical protein NLJ89_g4110 [Agrocybe chaxingu]|uniref:Isochorismatase-like domain-containing protein n=1 Tax=Agrocybe chaxingu TaxID=84603 RepID=A0A9W8MW85_9AGAR|nr:hypothetical protein NLJ89_g4110 [Agrocybe chaxingu]
MSDEPKHYTPISEMTTRKPVSAPVEYGSGDDFWVEYPSGLVDLSRTDHLQADGGSGPGQPELKAHQVDIEVDINRTIRVDKTRTSLLVIDMQNFFLHPDVRAHPSRLEVRRAAIASHPTPSCNGKQDPLGELGFNRARAQDNPTVPHPISGVWGYQTALDLFLKENGITTLFFSGVNTDQCVLGTLVDAYFRGYDCIVLSDATATTSPDGAYENLIYNAGGSYGFVTDTKRLIASAK